MAGCTFMTDLFGPETALNEGGIDAPKEFPHTDFYRATVDERGSSYYFVTIPAGTTVVRFTLTDLGFEANGNNADLYVYTASEFDTPIGESKNPGVEDELVLVESVTQMIYYVEIRNRVRLPGRDMALSAFPDP